MKQKFTVLFLILISLLNVFIQIAITYTISTNISVEDFGEFRNFLAIASFSGIFHLGIIDGLYLNWVLEDESPQLKDLLLISLTQICFAPLIFLFLPISFAWSITIQIFVQNILMFANNILLYKKKFLHSSLFMLCTQLTIALLLFLYSKSLSLHIMINMYNIVFIISTSLLVSYCFFKKYFSFEKNLLNHTYGLPKYILTNIKKGLPILIIGLIFVGFQNLDKIILAKYYNKYTFGLYAFSFTIINIAIGIILSISNFILRKFIDKTIDDLVAVYTKLTLFLIALNQIFTISLAFTFKVINILVPQYKDAEQFTIILSYIVFPYIVLQLLLFNLFKRLNSITPFLLNTFIHLLIFSLIVLGCSLLQVSLRKIPNVSIFVFFSCFIVSEWLLIKKEKKFLRGINYRISVILLYIIFNIVYANIFIF